MKGVVTKKNGGMFIVDKIPEKCQRCGHKFKSTTPLGGGLSKKVWKCAYESKYSMNTLETFSTPEACPVK